MAKYLISFPSDAHAVIDEAKACRCAQELRVFQFDPQS